MLRGFDPVCRPDARVLVLGSLPGAQSLAQGQYYAHPRNQFWQLVGTAIGTDLQSQNYEDRLENLVQHGIALWDVVGSGYRPGSLDSRLRVAERADLPSLIGRLPDLRAIAFNGKLAGRLGLELGPPIAVLHLPSSSPANTAPLKEKQAQWNALASYLADARAAGRKKARRNGGP